MRRSYVARLSESYCKLEHSCQLFLVQLQLTISIFLILSLAVLHNVGAVGRLLQKEWRASIDSTQGVKRDNKQADQGAAAGAEHGMIGACATTNLQPIEDEHNSAPFGVTSACSVLGEKTIAEAAGLLRCSARDGCDSVYVDSSRVRNYRGRSCGPINSSWRSGFDSDRVPRFLRLISTSGTCLH